MCAQTRVSHSILLPSVTINFNELKRKFCVFNFAVFPRMNLIRRIAREQQMDFIFLGTNATRLSIQLLTDMAQGRGNQVDSEIVSVRILQLQNSFLSFR